MIAPSKDFDQFCELKERRNKRKRRNRSIGGGDCNAILRVKVPPMPMAVVVLLLLLSPLITTNKKSSDRESISNLVVGEVDAFVSGGSHTRNRVVSISLNSNNRFFPLSLSPSSEQQQQQQQQKMSHQEHQQYYPPFSPTGTHTLNPVEMWCTTNLSRWYRQSLKIKCPFFRRRSTDLLDGLESIMRFLIIRHKSLPLIGPPLAWTATRTTTDNIHTVMVDGLSRTSHGSCPWYATTSSADTDSRKTTNLSPQTLLDIIRNDWKPTTSKGYYLTGKLSQSIYRDDCFFEGPDPDMPVRGLHKYLNAASQLFETKSSTAELLDISIIKNKRVVEEEEEIFRENPVTNTFPLTIRDRITSSSSSSGFDDDVPFVIVAEWKLSGVLHLPWHPKLPTWTGRTIYHFDSNHLVKRHEEEWDISVLQAFTQTLWPQLGNKIWHHQQEDQ